MMLLSLMKFYINCVLTPQRPILRSFYKDRIILIRIRIGEKYQGKYILLLNNAVQKTQVKWVPDLHHWKISSSMLCLHNIYIKEWVVQMFYLMRVSLLKVETSMILGNKEWRFNNCFKLLMQRTVKGTLIKQKNYFKIWAHKNSL
jgi:hypothetical protein